MKRTALRARSAKQAKIDRLRKKIRTELFELHPLCQRCGERPPMHLHELLRRGQSGSPTDIANIVALCAECHRDAHLHPTRAREEGWLIFRKDVDGAA
jgi:5-methylcytosine-specific restriction endonuclease McrA